MSNNSFEETLSFLLRDIVDYLENLKTSKLTKLDIANKSKLIEKINKTREEYPQLNLTKNSNIVDKVSLGSQSEEFYDDIGTEGDTFNKQLKKNKSSPNLSENQSSSDDCRWVTRGFLIRKSAGKKKPSFVSKLQNIIGRKYCVVENGLFSIFDNGSSKKPSYSFHLFGYEVKVPSGQNKELVFELICPGRKSFQFAAGSKEDLTKWTSALKAEVQKQNGSRPSIDKNEDDPCIDERADDTYTPTSDAEPGEELYDDIAPETNAFKPPQQEPPEIDASDEIYDDIADNHPASVLPPKPIKQAKLPPAVSSQSSNAPNNSMTLPISQSKSGIVSSKDGVPYDKMYYGKWDCSGDAKDELSFKHGDIVTVLSQEFDSFGWWVAELSGTIGLVPRDYLTPAYELIPSR